MSVVRPATAIRIEVPSRRDALELTSRLRGLHTYLVQLADTGWHVCVRFEDPDGEKAVRSCVEHADRWASERHLGPVVRLAEGVYSLRG